jgi:preprotein translocase subunit SecB
MSAPEQKQEAPLQITVNVQYIKDFSFESPNAPAIFAPSAAQPMLNMGVNVQTRPLAEFTYEVLLLLKLEAKIEDKTAFIAELTYGGVFSIPSMPEEQIKLFLLVEAPRLLFPFARAILAATVRDGGFPQVLINPIDFYALYQANAVEMAKEPAGNA